MRRGPVRRPRRREALRHDSPYTYFTSGDLHLGEISLECSRAGAAADALWLTLQVFPLAADDGLGPILAASRRAAKDWGQRLAGSDVLSLHLQPELDIVTYFPTAATMSEVDARSAAVLRAGMDADEPLFLSVLSVDADALAARHPEIDPDAPSARVLRSVLMKPEHEQAVEHLHGRVEALASG